MPEKTGRKKTSGILNFRSPVMKTFFIFIMLLLCTSIALSQKEYNNWYFGERAGITFNTADEEPVALLDGDLYTYEGCSAISDSNSNLLFYTNGVTVWNRLHMVMNNGTDLLGHESSSQSALIVPKPGSNNIYYIFTTDALERNYNNGFNYSIVDMNLDNGMGSVTQKNTNLLYNKSEKVTSISGENGKETWIVTQDADKQCFLAYLLTDIGLSSTPVKSPNKIDLSPFQNGMLKISPNGDKLAITQYSQGSVYLYDFNFLTGKITNEIIIKSHLIQSFVSYGLEFSSTGKFLYYTSINSDYSQNYLHQIDITSNNAEEIIKTEKIINQNTNIPFLGTLQIGPNKKIYLAVTGNDISVIHKPDSSGNDCNFEYNGCKLNGRKSLLGLPPIVQKSKLKLKKPDSIFVCERDAVFLNSSYFQNAVYKWSGPESFSSNMQNPVIPNSKPVMSGEYICKTTKNGRLIDLSITIVTVNPRSKIIFSDLKFISVCNDSLDLIAVENPQGCKIQWKEINSTENKVTIRTNGSYTVYVENQYGCIDSATIQIDLNKKQEVKIISNNGNSLCTGEKILLSADKIFSKYIWSTGETTSTINVTKGGKYILKVKSDAGCEGIDSILIEEFEKPDIKFEKSVYTICKGDSLNLSPLEIKSEYVYIWSDGFTNPKRTIKQTSELFLIAKSLSGCRDTTYVKVTVLDFPFAEIFAHDTVICNSGNLTLTAKNINPDFEYLWSTGETSESINVSESGIYKLTVKNKNMCSDTDSVQIIKSPDINLQIISDKNLICKGDSSKIYSNIKYSNYYWSTDETSESIFVKEKGIYSLIVINEFGCADTAFQEVDVLDMPVASILADKTEVCFGEKIILTAENFKPEFDYKWSNGEKTESITVSESGTYKLIVSNQELCTDTSEIEVKVHPDLALELTADNTNLCFDDSTKIFSKANYYEYFWSTGETTESITVHDAGVYQLTVKNEFGCSDSAEIEISKFDAKLTFDKEKLVFDELCLGDSQTQNMKMTIETNSDFVVNRIHTTTNNFNVINSNSYLKTYKNGDSVDLKIMFKPNDAGEFFDTLFVESEEPCIYKAAIPIYGSSKALFRFGLPDIATEVGQRIEIPVNSALTCPNANKLTTDYEITISVDKAYFQADSVLLGEIIENEIVGNDRILKIQARAEFEKLNGELKPINIIYGQALIGRSETVPLIIQNVDFPNERYYPEYQNGSLKIDGCVNDLSGIQIFKPTTLKVAPNPADGDLNVTVGTQEEGSFSIIIYDFQGCEVAKSEFTRNNRIYEENDYTFNISGLGTGVYSVHLTAPWTLKREQLVIVK